MLWNCNIAYIYYIHHYDDCLKAYKELKIVSVIKECLPVLLFSLDWIYYFHTLVLLKIWFKQCIYRFLYRIFYS